MTEQLARDYMRDYNRSLGDNSFLDKWCLFIRLVTGVHMLELRGVQAWAAANVTATRCREVTSGPSRTSRPGSPRARPPLEPEYTAPRSRS